MEQAKSRDPEVIIVGGGPCGLVLANELGRRGIAVTLFDDKPSTSPHPQANATQARTMEHFRRLGFADTVRQAGLPRDYPTDAAYFTRLTKHELARFSLPTADRARAMVKELKGSWSAAELPHRCSQMYIERILRAEAERLPSVSLNYGWRVTNVVENENDITVEATGADRTTRRVTAPYLVGCDGPRSETRKRLGISYKGEAAATRAFMGGRMHAIYFRSASLYGLIPAARAWQYWSVNPERRSTMVALDGDTEFVIHLQLRAEEEQIEISEAMAKAMITEAIGYPCDIDIVSRLSWTAGLTLVAEHFQKGRIFLGGDAVHLFTPTGGLGYNTAVEDAVNLGWKLAAALRGWGGPQLVATYEQERQPLAFRNTGYARHFANSIGLFVPGAEIEDDTPAGAEARRVAGAHLNSHARAEFNIPGITFGGRYDGSPIIIPDGTTPPPDEINTYVPTACPGGRAPHAWLADGRSLFDSFGFDFTLLRLGPDAPDPSPFLAAAAARGMPLTLVEHPSPELRELYEADLAIIRPDQIVAWRGNAIPASPGDILARVTGTIS